MKRKKNDSQEVGENTKKQKLEREDKSAGTPELLSVGHSDMLAPRLENSEHQDDGANTMLLFAAGQKWDSLGRLINDNKITADMLAARYENSGHQHYGANTILFLAAHKKWDLLSRLIDNNQMLSSPLQERLPCHHLMFANVQFSRFSQF